MALKPEDPSGGFQQGKVVAFINEKMAGHAKGPEFYLENISLSWEEVENKLRDILEDSAVPSEAKDACAWSSLALGVRFAHRQSQLHGHRVHWLQDFAKLHKSAAQALASDLKELTAQQEMERKEAAFQLRQTQENLAEMRKERDLLRWKLLQTKRERVQVAEETGLATASGAGTEGAGEEEEEAVAAATSAPATSAPAAGTTGRGRRRQKDAEGAEATKKLGRSPVHLPGAKEQKNYTSGGQREGDLRSVETTMFYFSGTLKPGSRVTPSPLPVQLPPSFTYSYSCPSSPFPAVPTPSPPAATFTAEAPSLTSPNRKPSDVSSRSDGGSQGTDPQESQRDRRDSEPHQQRRPPIFRRPGDWDCRWCKAVNFSRREICFRCRRGTWRQSPQ
uniref:RanBP2-type domain-containing protein n=1 Tax=Ursus americanus TaxID=9643 RepID=A0A452RIR5_URSAM